MENSLGSALAIQSKLGIDMVFPKYELLDACQDYSKMKKLSHTGCIDMVSPQCESAYEYQEKSSMKKLLHNESI